MGCVLPGAGSGGLWDHWIPFSTPNPLLQGRRCWSTGGQGSRGGYCHATFWGLWRSPFLRRTLSPDSFKLPRKGFEKTFLWFKKKNKVSEGEREHWWAWRRVQLSCSSWTSECSGNACSVWGLEAPPWTSPSTLCRNLSWPASASRREPEGRALEGVTAAARGCLGGNLMPG